MYKLTIGMATGGTVRSETLTSLIGAMDVLKANGVEIHLNVQVGGYVARNRNQLVEEARKASSTHLMFIDNDMVFRPSGIQRLLDADKDIIGGNYNARGVPGRPIVSTLKLDDRNDGLTETVEIPRGLIKVHAVATGFMMVKLPVFEKMDKPYFVAWESEEGEHHTEDVEFCVKAHKKGFDVWCNTTIPIGHIGTQIY